MKVAAYCRVSTDREDQANSFESQQRYFRDYIRAQPGWTLYRIYADEGITGTSTARRTAFHQMIRDAERHLFDLILTKEVSRFSRNILDTISYTRLLRAMGVGVRFVNDGIDTQEPDAELRLSILGSIAQEESRRTSERVKWGQTRRMEQGVVFGRSLLGYDVQNGKMTVNPAGAELVRLIFHKCVYEGKGTTVIARELREAGHKTFTGSCEWRSTVVLKILRNEKYCGDLKQKKTITPDYLTHRKQYNHGEEDFICLSDHHEPIVSREVWEAAQRELTRRDIDGRCAGGHGSRYPLSGKIRCGACGRSFVSRSRQRGDRSRYRVWRCATAAVQGKRCQDPSGHWSGCDVGYQLRDEAGIELVRRAFGMLELDRAALAREICRAALPVLQAGEEKHRLGVEGLRQERREVEGRKRAVLDAFFAGSISEADMRLMNESYDSRLSALDGQIAEAEQQMCTVGNGGIREQALCDRIEEMLRGQGAPDRLCGRLLDHITAFPGRRLEVRLKHLSACWTFALQDKAAGKREEQGTQQD